MKNINSNSDIIKAKFIDYIFECNPFYTHNFCIGQEVMYGTNRLFADMVLIINDKLYAVEIKAQNDDLRRIENQLSNYNKIFDSVFVITTDNHISKIKALSNKKIGIYLFTKDGTFKEIKKAPILQAFSKEEALNTIPASFLKKYFSTNSKLTADQARLRLVKQKKSTIKDCLHTYMKCKISYKYDNFLNEKGESVHFEDIPILSLRNYSVLK
jgi:hypothetical protein